MKNEETRPSGGPSAAPATSYQASGRSSRRRGRKWLWISIVMLLALGVAGVFLAKPAWRAVKKHRAIGFAREAEEFVKEEKWTQAFQRLRSALQLDQGDPAILRLAATLYGTVGLDIAYPYYDSLLGTGTATPQDREDYAALALRLSNAQVAAAQIQTLLAAGTPSSRTYLLAAQLQAVRRNFTNAVHYAREAVRTDPANGTNTLALASFLSATRNRADAEEALAVLWPVAESNATLRLPAFSAILAAPASQRADREKVSALLEAIPQRSLPEDLLLREAQAALDPSTRVGIADGLIEQYGRGTPDQIAAVATWLNRQQLYNRTLDLLLPDIARRNPKLFQLRYEALMGREDFRGAYDFLAGDVSTKDPLQLEFLRCTTALRMKDTDLVSSHFKNLLELAKNEPRLLRAVADFAMRNGRKDIANEATQRLARNPRDAEQAYGTLMRIADAQGETWVARDYGRKLAAVRPQGPTDALKLQLAYYDLLLNENLDSAFPVVEAMQRASPNDFSRRVVLGLALLRKNEPKQALDAIDLQLVRWPDLPPGIRAIIVAILGANQREKALVKLVPEIPIGRLKPEERELIRPYAAVLKDTSAQEDPLREIPPLSRSL